MKFQNSPKPSFSQNHLEPSILSQNQKPLQPNIAMADHGGDNGSGDIIDHPRDEGEAMETEIEEGRAAEDVAGFSAEVAGSGDIGNDERPEVEDVPE